MDSKTLTEYYVRIKSYVDSYVSKWQVKPSRLKHYLNKERLGNFLERENLTDVNMIDRVLEDVISSYIAAEKDMIMTFESFEYEEVSDIKEVIYLGVSDANIEHEKLLADVFDTSLSRIDVLNKTKHVFRVDGMVSDQDVVVFSNDDLGVIKANLVDHFKGKVLDGKFELENFSIDLRVIVDVSALLSRLNDIFDDEYLVTFLSDVFRCSNEGSGSVFVGVDPDFM